MWPDPSPMRNSTVAFVFRVLSRGQSRAQRTGSLRIESTTPRASMQTQLFVAATLCVLALLIRLPWFFVDVIDIDEGAFVLMGRSLADGRLPYTEVWDN